MDEWEVVVMPWLFNRSTLRIFDILTDALKFEPDRIDRASQLRVARILKCHGWQTRVVWKDGAPARLWEREPSRES